MSKANNVPKPIYLRVVATRKTITCRIPEHFNDMLANTGQELETYTPEKRFLNFLGISGKRFHQLMRGESEFLFCEAAAYSQWFCVPLADFYTFNPLTTKK